MQDPRGPFRTISTVTFVPAAERTDGGRDYGDRLDITYEECEHVGHGNPSMSYKVGAPNRCFACGQEGRS